VEIDNGAVVHDVLAIPSRPSKSGERSYWATVEEAIDNKMRER
jgi:hypothetical protein